MISHKTQINYFLQNKFNKWISTL